MPAVSNLCLRPSRLADCIAGVFPLTKGWKTYSPISIDKNSFQEFLGYFFVQRLPELHFAVDFGVFFCTYSSILCFVTLT